MLLREDRCTRINVYFLLGHSNIPKLHTGDFCSTHHDFSFRSNFNLKFLSFGVSQSLSFPRRFADSHWSWNTYQIVCKNSWCQWVCHLFYFPFCLFQFTFSTEHSHSHQHAFSRALLNTPDQFVSPSIETFLPTSPSVQYRRQDASNNRCVVPFQRIATYQTRIQNQRKMFN